MLLPKGDPLISLAPLQCFFIPHASQYGDAVLSSACIQSDLQSPISKEGWHYSRRLLVWASISSATTLSPKPESLIKSMQPCCQRFQHRDPACHTRLSDALSASVQGRPAMMPNWDKDYNAGRTLLTMNGLPVFEAPIHLEGGSIHSDGQGTMVVTEECLLDPSRNPDLGREGIEKVRPGMGNTAARRACMLAEGAADAECDCLAPAERPHLASHMTKGPVV